MVKISSSIHTRIENGLQLRKEVLETALEATELFQKIKLYKKENTQKKRIITKFKKEITELKGTLHELEFKDLPRNVIPKEPKIKPIIKTPKEIKKETIIEKPAVKSEIEKELDNLKSKIEKINV